MSPALRKLSLGLSVITVLMILVLIQHVRDARLINVSPQTMPLISTVSVEIPLEKTEPLLGNPGAPLTVIAYLNLDDTKSREYYTIMTEMVRKNPTKIRLVVKHYPEEAFFSNPLLVHQALYCADKQGKFWAFADGLAASTKTWRQAQLTALAEANYLSIKTWELCLTDQTTLAAIQSDVSFVKSFGLPSAPIIFLNNKLLNPEEEVDLRQLLLSFITPSPL